MKKNQRKVHIYMRKVISTFIILSFFALILGLIFSEVSKNKGDNLTSKKKKEKQEKQEDKEVCGVFLRLDKENKKLLVFDFNNDEEISLSYSGASDIRDKFNEIISITQIKAGLVVDIKYKDNLIEKMNISNKVWEHIRAKNVLIDYTKREILIGRKRYKYSNNIIILDDNKHLTIEDLAKQDILSIWGIDENIISIRLNKGHGYVKLKDYEGFIGSYITVGNEEAKEINNETLIIVREGEHNLVIEAPTYSVTKSIRVGKNTDTIVSLKDLGPQASKVGLVNIITNPENIDIYIDGQMVLYDKPLELEYGLYQIKAKKAGHHTYEGDIEINTSSRTINIRLPIVNVDEEADIEIQDDIINDDIDLEDLFDGKYKVDKDHNIYIQNPIGASVYLNGEFMVTSPGKFQKIIGNHVLTFIKEGYKVKSYTINVVDDKVDKYINMPDLEKEDLSYQDNQNYDEDIDEQDN